MRTALQLNPIVLIWPEIEEKSDGSRSSLKILKVLEPTDTVQPS